jgi:hypothetical protein
MIDPDESMGDLMILGSKPIKVKDEFPQIPAPQGENVISWNAKQDEALKQALLKSLKRNGVGAVPKSPVGPFIDKNLDKIKEMLYKRLYKIPESVV